VGAQSYVRGRSGLRSRGGRRRPGALILFALGACLLAAAMLFGAAAASARIMGAGGGAPGGVHVTYSQTDKAFIAYSFVGLSAPAVGVINETNHTIAVTVPVGTNVTALVATFTISGLYVTVPPSATAEVSGSTSNDFTNSVTYKVRAGDYSTQDYVVTVTMGAGAASTIAANGGNAQTVTVGTGVATAPSVIVKDANGSPVSGTSVTFAVASGGGAITGASATTNAGGIATVGSWTLGTVAGANTLTATASGLAGSPVSFSATGSAGVPTQDVIETAPDSSGVPIGARSVAAGSSFRLYVNACDQYGNFFGNTVGFPDWSLTSVTGRVAGGDVVITDGGPGSNYATFTGHLNGSCVFKVVVSDRFTAQTGTITVTGAPLTDPTVTVKYPTLTTVVYNNFGGMPVINLRQSCNERRAGTSAKRWVTIKKVTRRANARGVIRWKYKLPAKGTYSVRASIRKTAKHAAYKTKWIVFTAK